MIKNSHQQVTYTSNSLGGSFDSGYATFISPNLIPVGVTLNMRNIVERRLKKIMKNTNKKIITPLMVILGIGLVMAVGTYYALATITFNINQPISVTGDGIQTVDCDAGEICLGNLITISNSAGNNKVVTVTNDNSNLDVDVSYMGKIRLVNKHLTDWTEESVNGQAIIYYTVLNNTFSWRYQSSSVIDRDAYTLIYYKDNDANVDDAQRLVTLGVDGGWNYYLPHHSDWNEGPDANYCNKVNTFDDYEHCNGAKLWLVPTDAIDGNTVDWSKANEFLFETDLIWYSNTETELTVPANSFIEFQPQFEVSQYASDGPNTIEITVA